MNPRIYLDLDGVLADFVGGAHTAHGRPMQKPSEIRWNFMEAWGMADGMEFWAPLGNPDFWQGLPVLDDGREFVRLLLEKVPVERVNIFSSGLCPGSVDGKRRWLRDHFPQFLETAIFGHKKYLAAGPDKVLVDDHQPNVGAFLAHGGHAVLVPRPWNEHGGDDAGQFDPQQLLDRVLKCWELAN